MDALHSNLMEYIPNFANSVEFDAVNGMIAIVDYRR